MTRPVPLNFMTLPTAIETEALEALRLLDISSVLGSLGLNKRQQGCGPGDHHRPGSERSTPTWLCTARTTGELLEIDFGTLSDRALYRTSDHLFKHKTAWEDHMFGAVETLFNLQPVVTLYDLTNRDFKRNVRSQPKAKHRRSKERRLESFSTAAAF
ncbi:MAG: hypothetical protein OXC62_03975 [Aestuariivita sp.]|nr:hypothetical protein [Aestuariivita sp.]